MRKYLMLGASLLLLAATACNREKEVLSPDGFVKLRFSAVVADDDTRTAYENDKTASWVPGDAISVYVTNGTDGQVVTFTADETLTFEGTVPEGYTTIVAGAYPVDPAHTFDATGVKTLHFPAAYTLAEGADPASVLPLAGSFVDGQMVFRHPAGALKFTIDNVPATAVRFRFTTFGHRINGNYAPDAELEDTLTDAEKSVDINFPAAEGSHSFYVPMPAGELYADSVIELYDAEDNLLFQKVAPQPITVSRNVIKRMAAVESWKKNEAWQAAYLRDVYNTSSQKVLSYVQIAGTSGLFDISVSSKSYFERYYGSAEAFLTSSYIPNRKAGGSVPKTANGIFAYNKLSPGPYVAVLYGLDDAYNFTGEYNLITFDVPEFTTPEGWSLTYIPNYQSSSGDIYPAVRVQVPEGTSWASTLLKKETFVNNYGSDVAACIWAQRTATSTIRTNTSLNLYYTSLDEGDYVFISYGVTERPEADADRTFSYEYCLLEFTYTAPSDEPTDAYLAWIGKWSVTESGTDSPATDTWTITAKQNNQKYSIVGLCNRSSTPFTVEGRLNNEGGLQINAQKEIGTTSYKASDGNTYEVTLNLYGRKERTGSAYTGTYQLLKAELDPSDNTVATLSPAGETYFYYTFYGSYVDAEGTAKGVGYGTRSASATMTRIVENGAPAPEGWEEEDFVRKEFPAETVKALPAE